MTVKPYYSDGSVSLYLGRMEDVLPELGQFDACITDPPYGETSLAWDRWPARWPSHVSEHTRSLWCFGSMKMFTSQWADFVTAGWKLSQDTVGEYEVDTMVWEKHNGSGFASDRFKRVHELAVLLYRGPWSEIHHDTPRAPAVYDAKGRTKSTDSRNNRTPHTGAIGGHHYEDDGMRLVRSVVRCPSVRRGLHPTEKPGPILEPLIRYSVPVGGGVLDPFAGSGSTLLTARSLGRTAVGVEASEAYCEAAAKRLSIPDLFAGVS